MSPRLGRILPGLIHKRVPGSTRDAAEQLTWFLAQGDQRRGGAVPVDDELNLETNPDLDQYFLSDPGKLALLIEAAGIRPTDHVVEVGAGIGTVAARVPLCQSLTVIEYDAHLIPHLRRRVPHARVIEGDALAVLSTVRCDVLLSNLPSKLTPALVGLLPTLHFRAALVTVASIEALALLKNNFTLEAVVELVSDDFRPRQQARAEIVRIRPLV